MDKELNRKYTELCARIGDLTIRSDFLQIHIDKLQNQASAYRASKLDITNQIEELKNEISKINNEAHDKQELFTSKESENGEIANNTSQS